MQNKMTCKNENIIPNTRCDTVILKLIFLWAFVEAGLGGLLHLFHIPVTGLVVGGFAVIIIVLLAKYSNNNYAVLLKALGIVLAVKFLVSPYTPFGAYVAVGFQGLLAVLLFPIFKLNKITVFLFATLIMIESGLQKPIIAYYVFGKEFWNVTVSVIVDLFRLSKENVNATIIFFLIIYMVMYLLWGILLSHWANYIRENIETLHVDRNVIKKISFQISEQKIGKNEKKRRKYFLPAGLIIIGITLLTLLLIGKLDVFYLVRAVIILLFLIIAAPLLIKKHQNFLFRKNKAIVSSIVEAIPKIKFNTQIAWKLSRQSKGINRIKQFVIHTIWLNVFFEPEGEYKIIILTGPVQTGKSGALLKWVSQNDAGGFITPTISGKKMLHNILSGESIPFEIPETTTGSIQIGIYTLDENAFVTADKIIAESFALQKQCIVIDEIGKLELQGKGYNKMLTNLFKTRNINLLLVVRDTLVDAVITKYKIEHPTIIYKHQLKDFQQCTTQIY